MTPNPRYLDMTVYGGDPEDKTWFAPRVSHRAAIATRLHAMEERARIGVTVIIKRAARDFIRHPAALNAVAGGLQFLSPSGMITRLRQAAPQRQRWTGFGGEVPVINYRAAMLCARLQRARQALAVRRGK